VTWDFLLGMIVMFAAQCVAIKVFALMLGSHAARAVVDYLLPMEQPPQPPDQDKE
jgi:hypothetical protein